MMSEYKLANGTTNRSDFIRKAVSASLKGEAEFPEPSDLVLRRLTAHMSESPDETIGGLLYSVTER